jgi:hypothetical protein
LVKLAEVADPSAARVYAALLDSAGIPVQLQGESLGPYVVTVGDWAVTELWIPESAWDDAVEILTAEGPSRDLTLVAPPQPPGSGDLPPWLVATAIGTAVGLVALWLVATRF